MLLTSPLYLFSEFIIAGEILWILWEMWHVPTLMETTVFLYCTVFKEKELLMLHITSEVMYPLGLGNDILLVIV